MTCTSRAHPSKPLNMPVLLRKWTGAAMSLLLISLLGACATLPRSPAVPAAEAQDVTVLGGLKDIRYWGDQSSPVLIESIRRAAPDVSGLGTGPGDRHEVGLQE